MNFSRYAAAGGIAVAARFWILLLDPWALRPMLARELGFVTSIFVISSRYIFVST